MNIGIFGGSFNPPHMGHLIVIESVRDQLRFDKVLFIPSAKTPNKPHNVLAPGTDRLHMTKIAVEGTKEFDVSDLEVNRAGTSYTIDTLMALSSLFPRATLSLIIGTDNLMEFQSWKAPEEILARAELVVMSRPGFESHSVKTEFARLARTVHVPAIGISGTDIRRRVKLQRSIRYLVPKSVEEYIHQAHLYRD